MAIQTPKQKNVIYSDFTRNMKKNPFTKDLVVVVNEIDVMASIEKIIKTNHFEIPYNPFFGANIRAKLFENFTPQTEAEIKNEVTFAIQDYEPRANLISVDVTDDIDNNALNITVTFSVINSSIPSTVTVTLTRVR